MNDYTISLAEAKEKLSEENIQRFIVLMEYGTMRLEYFAPQKEDTQSPHAQDELYIILTGTATLERANETIPCKSNDVLFVPAGMAHRFTNFSDDFSTWVIFYGADGGENSDK